MSDQNEPTHSGALPSVPLQPVVGTPRSDEACEDAEVWASRNPKGPVVPYRLAARMERELCAVKKALSEILDGVPMRYPKPCNFVMNVSHGKIEAARAAINSSNPEGLRTRHLVEGTQTLGVGRPDDLTKNGQ